MAFVKLPPRLRSVELRRPEGGRVRVDFSVFAGDIVRDQRARNRGAARWTVRSTRQTHSFDFAEMPIETGRGHVAAIVAALPADADTGPIIAAADLDADRRVDFIHREAEVLSLSSGYAKDYRGWRPGIGLLLSALALGLLAAALAYLAAGVAFGALPLRPTALLAGDSAAWSALISAAEAGVLRPEGPAVVGAAAGIVAALHRIAFVWARAARRARFQAALLAALWRGAGEALGFVQDNADAFRSGVEIEPEPVRPDPRPQRALRPDPVREPRQEHPVAARAARDRVWGPEGEPAPATQAHRRPARRSSARPTPPPSFLEGRAG